MCVCVYVCVCVCVCVGVVAMALEEEQHRQHEGEIRDGKRSLKVELKEMELAHQDATKTLKMVSSRYTCSEAVYTFVVLDSWTIHVYICPSVPLYVTFRRSMTRQ